ASIALKSCREAVLLREDNTNSSSPQPSFLSFSSTAPAASSPPPSASHTPLQTPPLPHQTASTSPDPPRSSNNLLPAHDHAPASRHTPPHTPATRQTSNSPVESKPCDRSTAAPDSPAHPSSSIRETDPIATASRALPRR